MILIALGLALWLLGVQVNFGPGALLVEAVLLATLIPLWRRGALGVRDLGLRLVPGARATALAFLGLLAYGWFNVLVYRTLHPTPITSNDAGISHQGTAAIVLAGVVACVGAPVAEEIFFRGLLYRCLRNRFAVLPACLIASVLFALDHTQYPLTGKLVIVSFGVITCLLYERTGSLLPGMALHSFVDGSGFERALTKGAVLVPTAYALLAVVLFARPPLKGLGRLLTGRPVFRQYPIPEPEPTVSGQLSLPLDIPAGGRDRRHTVGAPWLRKRTGRFAIGILCVVFLLFLAGLSSRPAVRSQASEHSRYPTCAAAGIDVAGGREGTCVEASLTSGTLVNVVDHANTLTMPEYRARILDLQIVPTRVSNASENKDLYPDGRGRLVSFELSITNTAKRSLQFGVGTGHRRRASYSPDPDVELALPESPGSAGDSVVTYPPIIEGWHAPTRSILQQSPIAPAEARTGWVSFIAPAWAVRVLEKRGADVDFFRVNHDGYYRGSIRLWK